MVIGKGIPGAVDLERAAGLTAMRWSAKMQRCSLLNSAIGLKGLSARAAILEFNGKQEPASCQAIERSPFRKSARRLPLAQPAERTGLVL